MATPNEQQIRRDFSKHEISKQLTFTGSDGLHISYISFNKPASGEYAIRLIIVNSFAIHTEGDLGYNSYRMPYIQSSTNCFIDSFSDISFDYFQKLLLSKTREQSREQFDIDIQLEYQYHAFRLIAQLLNK